MKCHAHPHQDASGQCLQCNVGLCHRCVSAFTDPLCTSCAVERNTSALHTQYTFLVQSIGLVILGLFLYSILPITHSHDEIGLSITPLLGFWGWGTVSRSGFNMSESSHVAILIAYLGLKCFAACWIGMYYGPVRVYTTIREIKRIKHQQNIIRTTQLR